MLGSTSVGYGGYWYGGGMDVRDSDGVRPLLKTIQCRYQSAVNPIGGILLIKSSSINSIPRSTLFGTLYAHNDIYHIVKRSDIAYTSVFRLNQGDSMSSIR